jgi:hypothetical protein
LACEAVEAPPGLEFMFVSLLAGNGSTELQKAALPIQKQKSSKKRYFLTERNVSGFIVDKIYSARMKSGCGVGSGNESAKVYKMFIIKLMKLKIS